MDIENKICEKYKTELGIFEEWIKSQPKLPHKMKKLLLIRYLKTCDFDQLKAQELLLINLEFRKKHPSYFIKRDIRSDRLQTGLTTFKAFPLKEPTKDNYRITVIKWTDNAAEYDVADNVKIFFMMTDVRFIEAVEPPKGEIAIIDFKEFSFKHLMRVVTSFGAIKVFLNYVQGAAPFNVVQNHFVNCSPILSKLMTMIRPFLGAEMQDKMHFHSSGIDSLYDFVDKKYLPSEYGGEVGGMDRYFEECVSDMCKHREYINDDLNWAFND